MRFRLRPRGRGQSVGRSHTCGWGWRRTCACTAWWRPSSGSPSSSSGWEPSCRRWWDQHLLAGVFFFNLRNSLGWVQRYVLLDGDPITLSRGSCPCWFFFFFSCLQGLKNFYPRTGHSDNKHWLKKRETTPVYQKSRLGSLWSVQMRKKRYLHFRTTTLVNINFQSV